MKQRIVLSALIGVCAMLIVVTAVHSGLALEPSGKSPIAAVVGARSNAGTGYVWKLVKYDKNALDLKWSGFQCDTGAPPVGCSGTYIFVFLPKKEGRSVAEFSYIGPQEKVKAMLKATITLQKGIVTVVTEKVKAN